MVGIGSGLEDARHKSPAGTGAAQSFAPSAAIFHAQSAKMPACFPPRGRQPPFALAMTVRTISARLRARFARLHGATYYALDYSHAAIN